MHFNADAPISINSLLFVPKENTERFGFWKMDPSVALHCRKVLIDAEPKGLLPDWLRFLKGVVDSADLPLNISRESMQDSALVQKLNTLITKRFIKLLQDTAKRSQIPIIAFGKHLVYLSRKVFILILITATNLVDSYALNPLTQKQVN